MLIVAINIPQYDYLNIEKHYAIYRSETEEIKANCTELIERFMIENGIDNAI